MVLCMVTMLFSDIYLIELEIKENGITDLARYASCIDLLLAVDGEGQLRTKLFNKRNDFNFPVVGVNWDLMVANALLLVMQRIYATVKFSIDAGNS